MLNHPPSFRQLQYLSALENTGHFGKAAEKCFVTQSTLSAGIAELEAQLNITLVERINKRNIKLTPLARELAEKGRKLIEEGHQWVEYAHQKNNPLAVTLSIGIIPTIAPFLIPYLLKESRKKYPQLKLDLRETNSNTTMNLLNQGELDMGILALPYPTGAMHCDTLFEDNFYVATHPESELAKKTQVTSKDLKNEHLLLLEEGHCLTEHTLQVCKFSYDRRVAGSSLFTMVQLVQNGFGVTLVPGIAHKALAKFTRKVVFLPLSDKGPHRQIALLTRESWQNVSAKNIIQTILMESRHFLN